MSVPIKQHWVPKFYLKYFATPETANTGKPCVWVFPREDGDPFLTGVNGICAENYLYSPANADGDRSFELEERFSKVEGLLSHLWPELATGFADMSDSAIRKAIALLASILLMRTPAAFEQTQKIHYDMVSVFDTFPTDEDGNPLISEILIQGKPVPFEVSSYPQFRSASNEALRHMFVNVIKESVGPIAEMLLEKRWSVIVADYPAFITTDNPVTYINRDPKKRTFGIKTEQTSVLLPLSPTRLLLMDDMHDEPSNQYYPLEADNQGLFNIILGGNANLYMISSRHPDVVCKEMIRAADLIQNGGGMGNSWPSL
jgi:hypothetical protein